MDRTTEPYIKVNLRTPGRHSMAPSTKEPPALERKLTPKKVDYNPQPLAGKHSFARPYNQRTSERLVSASR